MHSDIAKMLADLDKKREAAKLDEVTEVKLVLDNLTDHSKLVGQCYDSRGDGYSCSGKLLPLICSRFPEVYITRCAVHAEKLLIKNHNVVWTVYGQ